MLGAENTRLSAMVEQREKEITSKLDEVDEQEAPRDDECEVGVKLVEMELEVELEWIHRNRLDRSEKSLDRGSS
jgi:hypothetical protein